MADIPTRIARVELRVSDVERSAVFYAEPHRPRADPRSTPSAPSCSRRR